MTTILLPPETHYRCTGCGLCCRRGLHIWCTLEERIRLGETPWGEIEPSLAGERLFLTSGNGYRFALDRDGACRFLRNGNRCLQHQQLGYGAKTLTCRLFPFHLNDFGDSVRVSTLFSCPAVLDNPADAPALSLHELSAHLTEMRRIFPLPLTTESTAFDPLRSIAWRDLERLEASLVRITAADLPLERRILWATRFIDAAAELETLEGEAFAAQLGFLEARTGELAAIAPLRRPEARLFEPVVGRLLRALCLALANPEMGGAGFWNRQRARLDRVSTFFVTLFEGGGIRWPAERWRLYDDRFEPAEVHGTGDHIPHASIAAVSVHPIPPESAELIARLLRMRLHGRTYFGRSGWGLSVIPGLRLTLVLPSIALWLARLHAAHLGRTTLDHDDVRAGVMLVEHGLGHMGNLRLGTALVQTIQTLTRAGWPERVWLGTVVG